MRTARMATPRSRRTSGPRARLHGPTRPAPDSDSGRSEASSAVRFLAEFWQEVDSFVLSLHAALAEKVRALGRPAIIGRNTKFTRTGALADELVFLDVVGFLADRLLELLRCARLYLLFGRAALGGAVRQASAGVEDGGVKAPDGCSHVQVLSGAHLAISNDRILVFDESDAKPLLGAPGWAGVNPIALPHCVAPRKSWEAVDYGGTPIGYTKDSGTGAYRLP
jgi:hypothetical protein